MRTRPKILLFFISILLVTLACNIGKEPEGTTTPEQGEETTTEMTATSTEEQISSSETPQPSETLNPTLTIIPTLTNTAIPCDLVGWGSETIPDGTKFDPGEAFTKTWQLINRGSCAWTSGYQVVFVNGDQMNGPDSKSVTSGTVAPGSSVQIAVDLVAPDSPGTYRGNWMLRNPSGTLFSFSNGNPFYVEIVVKDFTDTPEPPAGPEFTLSFKNLHICSGSLKYATVKVRNTGSEVFESAQMYVVDIDTSATLYGPATNNTPFLASSSDCPPAGSYLNPGNSAFIAVSIGAAPTSGHTARFQLKLCTANGLAGDCKTHSIEFTIP